MKHSNDEINILRVVVQPSAKAIVFAEHYFDGWVYNRETNAVSSLTMTLLNIARDFDPQGTEGVESAFKYAAFNPPADHLPSSSQRRTVSDDQNLNIGIWRQGNALVSVFYKISEETHEEKHYEYIKGLAQEMTSQFLSKHGEVLDRKVKDIYEAFENNTPLPSEPIEQFAKFTPLISQIIDQYLTTHSI